MSAVPVSMVPERYTKPLNHGKMMQEFESVMKAYKENGVEAVQVASAKNIPNAVSARGLGGNVKGGCILRHLKRSIRSLGRSHYRKITEESRTPKITEVSRSYFEEDDFAFTNEKALVVGVVGRMNLTSIDETRKQLEPYSYKAYITKANPDYLHLDMCFNLVTPEPTVAYEAGLPDDFLALLEEKGIKVIAGTEEIVFKHSYDIEALGDNRVMSLKQNAFINDALRKEGVEVIEVDIAELLKAGGGVYYMILPLERY